MNHASLFSGIGGFDLAAEWMGWDNVFHCEIDKFCQRVLQYYWPNAITYDDIKQTDFTIWRGKIDILTGGFPCQPYSVAGKRKGTEDDRHLWPEMLRAIREIQPGWIVGENVSGILSWNEGLVFEQVCVELENEGYEVWPVVLPACGVDAPHRRDRVWFVAHSKHDGLNGSEVGQFMGEGMHNSSTRQNEAFKSERCSTQKPRTIENTISIRCDSSKSKKESSERRQWKSRSRDHVRLQESVIADTQATRSRRKDERQTRRSYTTRSFEHFPTVSPLCSRNDELSSRLDGITFSKWRRESIKGYGNAVVPELVYHIFLAIEQTNLR